MSVRICLIGVALAGCLGANAFAQNGSGGSRDALDGSGGPVTVVPGTASGDVSSGSNGVITGNQRGSDTSLEQGVDAKAGTSGSTQVR